MAAETALVPVSNTDQLLTKLAGHEAQQEVHALIRQTQEQASMIQNLKEGRIDIRVLGGQECFVKTETDGCLQGFRGGTDLSYREGKIYTVDAHESKGKWVEGFGDKESETYPELCKWHLTGAGAAELAGIMSVNIVYEHTPGVPNPEPEFSDDKREIIRFTYRLFAVGRDKAGNWRMERLVLPVATKDEFMETLAAKAKIAGNKEALRFGIKREFLGENGTLPKAHVFEKLADVGDDEIGYCCDLTHWAVKQLYGGIATRRKNASKKAYTVAKRLILSSWFGVGVLPVFRRGNDVIARFPTFGWRSPFDQEKMLAFARHVNSGGAISEFFGSPCKVVETEVSDEQVTQAIREEAEIADGEDVPEQTEKPETPAAPYPVSEPGPEPEPETPEEPVFVPESESAQTCKEAIRLFNERFGDGSAEELIMEQIGIEDIEGVLTMGTDSQATQMTKALHRAARTREEDSKKKKGARRVKP